MIQAVLFDLGSTLIHTEHRHHWAPALGRMQAVLADKLQDLGYALDPQAFGARFQARMAEFNPQRQTDWVEATSAWLLSSTLEELGLPPAPPPVLAEALAAYYAWNETQWRVVPGAHAALQRLAAAGLRLGIVSNAADAGHVQRLVAGAGLDGWFEPVLVSAAVGVRKPNPRIFELALEAWGLPAQACVMVGDSLGADILGAQLAGLRAVWFSAYAERPANAAHRGNITPEAEIASLEDLPGVLAAWKSDSPQRAQRPQKKT
jgi:HAD superfamily hydrolase (TIGR01662 family)